MPIPMAPKNLYVNRTSSYSIIRWDKVIQNIGVSPNYIPQYTDVIAYHVYKTENPAALVWNPLKTIITTDNFSDTDIFCIDFAPGNCLYKVCAENADGIGLCATTFGIIKSPDEVITVYPALWDASLWDVDVWG